MRIQMRIQMRTQILKHKNQKTKKTKKPKKLKYFFAVQSQMSPSASGPRLLAEQGQVCYQLTS